MRYGLVLIMTALAAPALAKPVEPVAQLRFSAHPELKRYTEEVSVYRGGKPGHFLLKKTIRPDGKAIISRLWTDSQACPAAISALEALSALPPAQPHVSGLKDEDISVIADGVTYRLETESRAPYSGRLFLKTNTHTPLAAWVDQTLAALQPCWQMERPAGFLR